MNIFKVAFQSIRHYWKTALVISLGTAVAISALTGSLFVGRSVKNNLRDIAVNRLGNVESAVQSGGYFTEELSIRLRKDTGNETITQPAVILSASVTEPVSKTVVPEVNLLGLSAGGFKYGIGTAVTPPLGREVYLSGGLFAKLNVKAGDFIVIKTGKTGAVPVETLFGHKELTDNIHSFSVKVIGAMPGEKAGAFNLKNETAKPENIYLSLDFLQKELKKEAFINTVLLLKPAAPLYWEERLKETLTFRDLGLKLKENGRNIAIESESFTLGSGVLDTAKQAADRTGGILSLNSVYIFNSINGAAPYSVIGGVEGLKGDEIILSDWLAEDLGGKKGQTLNAEYFELLPDGRYITKNKIFLVKDIIKLEALAKVIEPPFLDGVSDSKSMSKWKSPFPLEMSKIRSKDEVYWEAYKTLPKALVSLETARSFWPPQYTGVTKINISFKKDGELSLFKKEFLQNCNLRDLGVSVNLLREQALSSAQGSTDYSMLFVSLSFIIVLAALWLASFLFRILLEGRSAEAGIMLASGFGFKTLFAVYTLEGGLIILAGALLSLPLSFYYAEFILGFLKPIIHESSGFKLYVENADILTGVLAGSLLSGLSILRGIFIYRKANVRALLAKKVIPSGKNQLKPEVKSFTTLAVRSLFYSGKRSYLTAGLFAAAAFIIMMTAINRPESFNFNTLDTKSGAGGFNLAMKSTTPLFGDLNTPSGRKKNGFTSFDSLLWQDVTFTGCRLSSEGDDISCLNVSQPGEPKVLGLPESILNGDSFTFASAPSGVIPWAGLKAGEKDGVLPAYADGNSLEWILHKKIGDEIIVNGSYKAKVNGTLSGSIFAGVLLISEANFIKVYGSNGGYNYFLIRAKEGKEDEVMALLQKELGGAGYTVTKTSELLSAYAGIQNTYLFTFQILGGIGFLLGTFGIIAVLLQNVYERKREFALQAAIGFKKSRLAGQIIFENSLLLATGLLFGTLGALAISLPYIMKMHNRLDFTLPGITLTGMLLLGLASCSLAAYYSVRGNLVEALKSE